MHENSKDTIAATDASDDAPIVYDRRTLTYSNTFDSNAKRNVIRTIEWLTGKISVIRMTRKFERLGKFQGQAFWRGALDVMGIDLLTPDDQLARIPKSGPVVLVANHPHGLVDGMILAELIGRVRTDYRILTRSILTGIDEDATKFMIPVPFPHEPDAQKKMVDMRHAAMDHLRDGGLVALFPSGVVASSDTLFGPAIEREWNVFTAKMIRKSGASIVPCFFPGSNSRLYQIANRVSATLRQGLLLHEIVHACGKPQKPVIGDAIAHNAIKDRVSDQRAFMAWLRKVTMELGKTP
ncbi:lysophospholipid acyltransferase family protein [Yoonia sp.]|uniref:lysophospholipid acyltransferase family protein n=1 Tax=Yoonia sp. TaxID=2212373 RepID=UPI003F6CD561